MMTKIAIYAAGCFWGVEAAFQTQPGVISTQVGYTGGHLKNPTYEQVCSGTTGHAEAVKVTYDPDKISYETLLTLFWASHDPTTLNRQGPDIGSQYRSAIFTLDDTQHALATQQKQALNQTQYAAKPIVTEITPASDFYPAEDYHQHYLQKRGMLQCH